MELLGLILSLLDRHRSELKKRADEGYAALLGRPLDKNFNEIIHYINGTSKITPPGVSDLVYSNSILYRQATSFLEKNRLRFDRFEHLRSEKNSVLVLLGLSKDGGQRAIRLSDADKNFGFTGVRAKHPAMLQPYASEIIYDYEDEELRNPYIIEVLPAVPMLFGSHSNFNNHDPLIACAKNVMPHRRNSYVKDVGILPDGAGLVLVDPDSLSPDMIFNVNTAHQDGVYVGDKGVWLQHLYFRNHCPADSSHVPLMPTLL